MDFEQTILRVEDALKHELPGAGAQSLVAPRPRRDWPSGFDQTQVREAGGLLIVTARNQRAHVVLTVRAGHLGRHGGQISLPGGVVEPGETFEEAALREAHEEIGLPVDAVRTVGALTPIDITVSGFRLHPVVAAASRPLLLVPDHAEVAEILEIDIEALADPASFHERLIARDDITFVAPTFVVGTAEIWGATAMVLAEFLTLVGWPGPGSDLRFDAASQRS